MQSVADVGQMLQELAIGVGKVGYGDERFRGWVRKQLQGGLYERKKLVDSVWVGQNGARAREGGRE